MLGMSEALKKIHGLGDGDDSRVDNDVGGRPCIHFDLKPDNILIEREGGNWLITDFGQAATTERRMGTTPRIGGHFGTDAYAPPEIEDSSMEAGRAYDIWSWGCIMLEVTTFMILGHAGLNGTPDFDGLDKTRQAMPGWTRNKDERFFCQETRGGEYVLKPEIRDFMRSLKSRHARTKDSDAESKQFLDTIMDLITRMLNPKVSERVDISRVVEILQSALMQATSESVKHKDHQVISAPDEIILGGPELNQIILWHWNAPNKKWEKSNLEALENSAGVMRLHCWAQGREPDNVVFRRGDVKLLPLYAFWDPARSYDSRAWIDFLFLSARGCSELPNAKFSFDGHPGLEEARLVQSKLTSQNIEGSFGLSECIVNKQLTVAKVFKGILSKMASANSTSREGEDQRSLQLGSATVQIWIENKTQTPCPAVKRRESLVEQSKMIVQPPRDFNRLQKTAPPCRVAIYLHRHQIICTIKIDVNWVLKISEDDDTVLFFKPHPPGRNQYFYASWIRPTPDEFHADYPAGIPLSPAVLKYYEDSDSFHVEDIELRFLSAQDREHFMWTYLGTKKAWDDERKELESTVRVNRMPDGSPRPPDGMNPPPLPREKTRLFERSGSSRTPSSNSNTNTNHSRHDSTMESNRTPPQDSNYLTIEPPTTPGRRRG